MKARFLRQNINKIVSSLLTVWMSGVILLFCCEVSKARAAEADSCPLAKISHCDKTSTGESVSQFASFQTDNQNLDCCQFLPSVFDKARKIETILLSTEIATTAKISLPKFSLVKAEFNLQKFYRPIALNLSGTYLKNRVFRI